MTSKRGTPRGEQLYRTGCNPADMSQREGDTAAWPSQGVLRRSTWIHKEEMETVRRGLASRCRVRTREQQQVAWEARPRAAPSTGRSARCAQACRIPRAEAARNVTSRRCSDACQGSEATPSHLSPAPSIQLAPMGSIHIYIQCTLIYIYLYIYSMYTLL